MEKELKKAFHRAKYQENPDLAENIWHSITIRDKHISRIKLWVYSLVGFASLMGLIPAWKILSTDLAQSGFYEYFSLAFSNGSSFFSYWKEMTLSIVESLPVMSIILSLSLVFVFFLSLRFATKQITNNNHIGKTYGIA
ncbi:MAG: hypothetical protein NT161_01410 [Candidatus Nomurabacteria bacterium]|nr:hypothetical protein [Candidatus Nomurabacteria bacterium]